MTNDPHRSAQGRRTRFVALGLALLILLPVASIPLANAQAATLPPIGTTTSDIGALRAAGAPPAYASYWAGEWMSEHGWGGFDRAMRDAKAAGVTPVVYWYYWGDHISPACVENGCDGRDRAEWLSLTDQLADHLRTTLGGSEVIVVLENEFNKAGIADSYAPTFDSRLSSVARTIKAVPGTKIVVGFGAWGEQSWEKFPKTIAESDYIGFQMMRASTRDTEASYRGAAERTAYFTGFIAQKFAKPSFLYDLALSSYPDARWATLQAETLDAIFQKLASEGSTGLKGVVYRSLNDHYMDPKNYYGHAESHWGLRTSSGAAKPALAVWLKHATSSVSVTVEAPVLPSTTVTVAAPAPAPAPTPPAPFAPQFHGVTGNAYWVQTSVRSDRAIASVCAIVDGGACQPLERKSYGYADSFYVRKDAKVVFRATAADGAVATSPAYVWPSATLATATVTTVAAPTAKFTPYDGNTHWVQAKVTSDQKVASVCATVNGGTCHALSYRWWGAWANDVPAPTGSKVVFHAKLADGTIARSTTYTWPVN